ncbi:MAG: hypothetical protein WCA23_26080 [Stellaceae bacterium]
MQIIASRFELIEPDGGFQVEPENCRNPVIPVISRWFYLDQNFPLSVHRYRQHDRKQPGNSKFFGVISLTWWSTCLDSCGEGLSVGCFFTANNSEISQTCAAPSRAPRRARISWH